MGSLYRISSVVISGRFRVWTCGRVGWGRQGGCGNADEDRRLGQCSLWESRRGFSSTGGQHGAPSRRQKVVTAYDVLGVPRHCSQAQIRAAYRDLAKATHPDLKPVHAQQHSTASFVRILAAYQILSDPQKRAHYDAHLKLRAEVSGPVKEDRGGGGDVAVGRQDASGRDSDVVEWLRHYRWMVAELVHRPQLGEGGGFEERVRGEVHSALRKAYFGPTVRSQTLPNFFEAEERSQPGGVLDVLHLVSGRELLGVVRQVGGMYLSEEEKAVRAFPNVSGEADSRTHDTIANNVKGGKEEHRGVRLTEKDEEGAFVDLELLLFGKVVARASRRTSESPAEDYISVMLCGESVQAVPSEEPAAMCSDEQSGSDLLLGTIHGIGSTSRSCAVHDAHGKKTHIILQHWTPMVKHMQWYRVGGEAARCECRSRRARLPPSRYWLFEPRCATHNVGGWYFEIFGRTEERLSEEYQKALEAAGLPEDWTGKRLGLLHPAMYIMAAAYKTLDEESVRSEKRAFLSSWQSYFGHGSIFTTSWWKQKWRRFSFST